MRARYAFQLPPTVTVSSAPRHFWLFSATESSSTRGSFRWMSMSSTTRLTGSCAARAVRTVSGSPDDFLPQISAIFAPRPNLPRVWRTPY